ncbi:Glrx5, partial [Symbiodinium pilosum]
MSLIGSTASLRRPASATALKARKPHRSSVKEGSVSRPQTPSTSVGSTVRSTSSSALRRLQEEQQSNVGTALPVASSLGLVSVPSEVVRQGLLRIASEPNVGRDPPTWADPVSPKNRSYHHIGMEERPGPGWDFTNA